MIHFEETVQQKKDGRYNVNMPWQIEHASLRDKYAMLLIRFDSTSKRLTLEINGYRNEYQQVIKEWVKKGIIEVPEVELSLSATLPSSLSKKIVPGR